MEGAERQVDRFQLCRRGSPNLCHGRSSKSGLHECKLLVGPSIARVLSSNDISILSHSDLGC